MLVKKNLLKLIRFLIIFMLNLFWLGQHLVPFDTLLLYLMLTKIDEHHHTDIF